MHQAAHLDRPLISVVGGPDQPEHRHARREDEHPGLIRGRDAFPATVDPARRTWLPCSRICHGLPSSRRPTGTARKST